MSIGDKVSEKVVSKLGERLDKELSKSLNKEEELDSYLKRTMYGKLGKKMSVKALNKEGIVEEESPRITDKDLNLLSKGESSKSDMLLVYMLSGVLLLLYVLIFFTVLQDNFNTTNLWIITVLIIGILPTIMFMFKGVDAMKPEVTINDNIMLSYNKVYKYGNQYLRYYEIKDYPYFEEYLKDKKLEYIPYKKWVEEGKEPISPILTYKEINKFEELFKK